MRTFSAFGKAARNLASDALESMPGREAKLDWRPAAYRVTRRSSRAHEDRRVSALVPFSTLSRSRRPSIRTTATSRQLPPGPYPEGHGSALQHPPADATSASRRGRRDWSVPDRVASGSRPKVVVKVHVNFAPLAARPDNSQQDFVRVDLNLKRRFAAKSTYVCSGKSTDTFAQSKRDCMLSPSRVGATTKC